MFLNKKNHQGFTILGLNFDTNYGQQIHACCQFEFNGFEISVSTGASQPSRNSYPVCLTPIQVTNMSTGEETQINGSVEDAINFVIQQTSLGTVEVLENKA